MIVYETENIKSNDKLLNKNANEIWKFFLTHLTPPQGFFHVEGTHTYRRGNHRHTVIDFSFNLDWSEKIAPVWTSLNVSDENGPRNFSDLIEKYVNSKKLRKEIFLNKFVDFDIEEAKNIITDIVREAGYSGKVKGINWNL